MNQEKRRWRPNLFDLIIVVIVIAAAAVLYLSTHSSNQVVTNTDSATVRYTIELTNMPAGTGDLVKVGDTITDTQKNYGMGTVAAVEVTPYTVWIPDTVDGTYNEAAVPGYETILLTLESPASVSESQVQTSGGYTVKVGLASAAKGPCYAGSGFIVNMER